MVFVFSCQTDTVLVIESGDMYITIPNKNIIFSLLFSRQLQLSRGAFPPESLRRVPHGPVVHPDHPDCGHLLGLVLDGRGLGSRPNHSWGHNATDRLQ